jgi:hypothetical protein
MSAGISNPGVIDRDEMIDVNLTPVFLVTQAVLRKGAKKKGDASPHAALDTDLPRHLPHHWRMRLPRCARPRLTPPPFERCLWRHHAARGRTVHVRTWGRHRRVRTRTRLSVLLYTIVARSFIVAVMTALYFKASDPLFLVLDAIVLIGLLPSIYVAAQSTRASKRG